MSTRNFYGITKGNIEITRSRSKFNGHQLPVFGGALKDDGSSTGKIMMGFPSGTSMSSVGAGLKNIRFGPKNTKNSGNIKFIV